MDYIAIPYPTVLYGPTGDVQIAASAAIAASLPAVYVSTPPTADPIAVLLTGMYRSVALVIDPTTGPVLDSTGIPETIDVGTVIPAEI